MKTLKLSGGSTQDSRILLKNRYRSGFHWTHLYNDCFAGWYY